MGSSVRFWVSPNMREIFTHCAIMPHNKTSVRAYVKNKQVIKLVSHDSYGFQIIRVFWRTTSTQLIPSRMPRSSGRSAYLHTSYCLPRERSQIDRSTRTSRRLPLCSRTRTSTSCIPTLVFCLEDNTYCIFSCLPRHREFVLKQRQLSSAFNKITPAIYVVSQSTSSCYWRNYATTQHPPS